MIKTTTELKKIQTIRSNQKSVQEPNNLNSDFVPT